MQMSVLHMQHLGTPRYPCCFAPVNSLLNVEWLPYSEGWAHLLNLALFLVLNAGLGIIFFNFLYFFKFFGCVGSSFLCEGFL